MLPKREEYIHFLIMYSILSKTLQEEQSLNSWFNLAEILKSLQGYIVTEHHQSDT